MTRTIAPFPYLARLVAILGVVAVLGLAPTAARALDGYPKDGMMRLDTPHDFETLVERTQAAVKEEGMFVVAMASASKAAAGRGIEIPGNAVIEVYRNDFAVRMLEASVPAGIEAPLPFYLVEAADGSTDLIWQKPTAAFAPYRSEALNAMAMELDVIFQAIAERAVTP